MPNDSPVNQFLWLCFNQKLKLMLQMMMKKTCNLNGKTHMLQLKLQNGTKIIHIQVTQLTLMIMLVSKVLVHTIEKFLQTLKVQDQAMTNSWIQCVAIVEPPLGFLRRSWGWEGRDGCPTFGITNFRGSFLFNFINPHNCMHWHKRSFNAGKLTF